MSGGQSGDVRIMVELPDSIPPYRAYTINLNGMIVKKSMRAKLAWIVRVLVRRLGADIILIQETHFKTPKDMKEAFFPYGGQLRGYSPSASRSKGVVAYIPPDSVLYNMVHNVENDLDGRCMGSDGDQSGGGDAAAAECIRTVVVYAGEGDLLCWATGKV